MPEPAKPITQNQAADIVGVTLRHLQRIAAEAGGPPKLANVEGRSAGFPCASFGKWLRQRWHLEAGGADEALDPRAERAKLDRARRLAVEMENKRRSGELLPRDEVAAAWSRHVQTAKATLLSIPARASSELLRATTLREAEDILRRHIHEALERLSSGEGTEVDTTTA